MKYFAFSIFFLCFCIGLSAQRPVNTTSPNTQNDAQQGVFNPQNNCQAWRVTPVNHNGVAALEVVVGSCSKSPTKIFVNGTWYPHATTQGSDGLEHTLYVRNPPRGTYHVSVKTIWCNLCARISEGGGSVTVPHNVSGTVRLADPNEMFCEGNPITVNANVSHATRTSYIFYQKQANGQYQRVGNQIIRNGNTPGVLNLNDIFPSGNLGVGEWRIEIEPGNIVSSQKTTLNVRVRPGGRQSPCLRLQARRGNDFRRIN
ncbi:hypothetical protein [Lewinella sp. W8]|uniref:hypothetical protein n=1 Tax=Lewinella sp. W8 TaxID=2528208 RepID=UPI001067A104|nr:hypothetical protein [Lewinella sp. W8]MTB49618.1 hypothetical protein [Lewinella sp. W8]